MSENTADIPESPSDRNVCPRSPVGAVLLTLLMTGLVHVYCGELVIGLAWAAAGTFAGVISPLALATHKTIVTLASLPMWIVTIAAVVHVWSVARRCPSDYRLKQYNRSSVYVLLLVTGSCGVVGHSLLLRSNVVEAYVIPTSSMLPTLHAGDRFLVDKTAYRDAPVQAGDVIVFKNPANPKQAYVKRVVAVAGDKIEMRDGHGRKSEFWSDRRASAQLLRTW